MRQVDQRASAVPLCQRKGFYKTQCVRRKPPTINGNKNPTNCIHEEDSEWQNPYVVNGKANQPNPKMKRKQISNAQQPTLPCKNIGQNQERMNAKMKTMPMIHKHGSVKNAKVQQFCGPSVYFQRSDVAAVSAPPAICVNNVGCPCWLGSLPRKVRV